jgi:glycosyltransferase involved in cell wall biosynthesis
MTEPLTLLHVHSGNLYGGIERVLVTLRRLEDAAPLRHWYALGFGGRLRNELDDRATVIGTVRRRFPWTVRAGRRRLREAIGRIQPHVVLVHDAWAQSLLGPVISDAGVPMVRWFHSAPDPEEAGERRAAECVPRMVICNSRFTASAAAPFTVGVRMEVLYPPVPPPPAAPDPARARLRAHGGASAETRVVLEVARMEEGKGHAVLLDALSRLPGSLDWQAWFVGGPQRPSESRYFRRLRRKAARAGLGTRARFLGERSDTASLYAAADLYCQPNTAPDGFGLTFIEALYAGLPIVTTDTGGAREIVTDRCGLLVPPDDSVALAAAIQTLLSDADRRAALGGSGPDRATALCEPARQVRKLAGLLRRIASAG